MKTCFKFTNDGITYIALPKTPEVVNLIKAKNDEDLLGIIFNYGDMGYRSIMNVPFIKATSCEVVDDDHAFVVGTAVHDGITYTIDTKKYGTVFVDETQDVEAQLEGVEKPEIIAIKAEEAPEVTEETKTEEPVVEEAPKVEEVTAEVEEAKVEEAPKAEEAEVKEAKVEEAPKVEETEVKETPKVEEPKIVGEVPGEFEHYADLALRKTPTSKKEPLYGIKIGKDENKEPMHITVGFDVNCGIRFGKTNETQLASDAVKNVTVDCKMTKEDAVPMSINMPMHVVIYKQEDVKATAPEDKEVEAKVEEPKPQEFFFKATSENLVPPTVLTEEAHAVVVKNDQKIIDGIPEETKEMLAKIPTVLFGLLSEYTKDPIDENSLKRDKSAFCINNGWAVADDWFAIDCSKDWTRYFYSEVNDSAIKLDYKTRKAWYSIKGTTGV